MKSWWHTGAYPRAIVWPLVGGASVNALNTSMIATALVPLGDDLAVAPSAAIALVSTLYVASAIAQPMLGAVADLVGPRRTFVAGMCVVAVAGLVGGTAGSLAGLLAARVLAGIGTAAGYPTAMVLLRQRESSTGVRVPSSILGAIAIAVQVTSALGLPVGGVLTALWGWRAVFWVNAPLGLALALAGLAWFPRDDRRGRNLEPRSVFGQLDIGGVTLFAGVVTALSVALIPDPRGGWEMYSVAGAAAILFAFRESRARSPFLDVTMIRRHPSLAMTLMRNALTSVVMYCYLYGFVQWLQDMRTASSLVAAAAVAPTTLISIATAGLAARSARIRRPLVVGAVLGVAGTAALAGIGLSGSLWWALPTAIGVGLMTGLTTVANQSALLKQAPRERMGNAAGAMRAGANVAAIVSSGVIAFWYPVGANDAGLTGIACTMVILAGVVVVMVVGDRGLPATR
ncbi:MFS transporter [Nocardia sp. NPDC050713]|uniref:MFS transporter n=1 Tax=Nocardia sp. NPDC050713 TaxID=3154511 RepID=UPI0033DEB891